MSRILLTGVAGFIGFHAACRFLADGNHVLGIDNLNDYYDVSLKKARLKELRKRIKNNNQNFDFKKIDICNSEKIQGIFRKFRPDLVVHLAAQAGVRYSLENPQVYVQSNVVGFLNILEGCRHANVKHLVYASSSSVYGANTKIPFDESDPVDHPVSLYAATKKADELMAHTYAHLFKIPVTGLRFFTVYGPWGRPDMAYFSFADAIRTGRPIKVFNDGLNRRDFTYIDDIVEGIARVAKKIPGGYQIYNIGNDRPVTTLDMIEILERHMGQKAVKEFFPPQPGDVFETWADIDDLKQAVGFSPSTPLEKGLEEFVKWYKDYKK
jgi:UDP-glucuronate 4-epimerase